MQLRFIEMVILLCHQYHSPSCWICLQLSIRSTKIRVSTVFGIPPLDTQSWDCNSQSSMLGVCSDLVSHACLSLLFIAMKKH